MKHPEWNCEDLQRRLRHALDIAQRSVERFGYDGYTDPDDDRVSVRAEKVISETALLLVAASKIVTNEEIHGRVHRIARALIPYARSNRMLLGLCLEPALALDYASPHIFLKRLGYPDPDFDHLLAKALQSHAGHGRERVPHRMMEQEWLRNQWEIGLPSRGGQSISSRSVLKLPLDLLSGTRDDVYAFTHALMYASDFNLSPGRMPRGKQPIRAEAEAALGRCLDAEDYDLGGEVLLTWPLTGGRWSAAATFGFRVLTRVEDAVGFLPAPITKMGRANKLEGEHRTDYLLATAYHTIYVMGLLCAAALQPGKAPPASIPTDSARRGSCERILRHLRDCERRPHWRDDLDKLTELERDALGGLLLTIGLRRKVEQREFGAVAELLREGYACGLTNYPAARQAAEMLERLTVFGELQSRRSRQAA